jgi:hypothetical protein
LSRGYKCTRINVANTAMRMRGRERADATRQSAIGDAVKGGRWAGFTGFRE